MCVLPSVALRCVIALGFLIPMVPTQGATSQLWGEHGERWTSAGRLPDFSHAGYHRGEKPLPTVPQAANVRDFGAMGDGVTDDTRAINAAIAAARPGAIFLPAGRYLITDYVQINQAGTVLRGAGPDQTVLWFPRGLDEIHPRVGRTSTGSAASGYSFDGAFVQLRGDYGAKPLAKIVAISRRGDRHVEVDATNGLAVGQDVLLLLREAPDHSLKTHLYDNDPGDIARGKQLDTKMLLRVVAIDGSRVQFDRPLRFDTRAAWQPELRSFDPTVTESGIEGIRFEFPAVQYRGHFKENGANAIELRQVTNCWVRNVVIHNGDLGINLVACGNTVDGVVFTADESRRTVAGGITTCTGHHAIQCKAAEDNLITHFDVRASYIHDLTVEHASGNVFAEGSGADLNFDHHKDTPYENLFTAIDCGAGTRVWHCGGGASLGRQCAARGTFWSIRADRPIAPPREGWGPASLNFVGLLTTVPSVLEPDGKWLEAFGDDLLQPTNLHQAQLDRRVKRASGR